jgi:hypothetical protein
MIASMKMALTMLVMLTHLVIAQTQSPPEPARRVRHDLQPVDSALTCHSAAYHVTLRQVLFGRAAGNRAAHDVRMLVTPSFDPETLLSLQCDDKAWRTQVVRAPENVWTALREKRVVDPKDCAVHERVLPDSLGPRLAEATLRMLERTRYEAADGISLDGTTHTFFGRRENIGLMTAAAHSPSTGTRAQLLTDVADACIAHVLATDDGAKAALARVEAALIKLEQALAAVASPQQQTPR